jgi:RHS repeat-associated protein
LEPYTYDLAGNVVDDGIRTYSWDAENRLTSIGYKGQPGRTSAFRYDGLGRRLAIIETSTGGSAETRYSWCGGATPCQARSASDTTTGRFYQQGAAISAGTKIYFARDHLGSVRDVLNAQTGDKISSYDFDPYGRQRGTGLPVDFGFAGMLNHQGSGLNLTLFRAYDSKAGRWLSRDPVGERVGINLYSYVHGDVINRVDRFGLDDDAPGMFGFGLSWPKGGDGDWPKMPNSPESFYSGDWPEMAFQAACMGFRVTDSLAQSGHNSGSWHYMGEAIDVSVKDKTDIRVNDFIDFMRSQGYVVKDERIKPPKQKVWTGPHIHIERHDGENRRKGHQCDKSCK